MSNIMEEILYQLSHLTIDQMLEVIKKSGNTKGRRFRVTGPKGSLEGEVLDPYMGLIKFDGKDEFIMASEFRFIRDVTWELI
jgi:hypothetical protein